jgi:hypothetical protein
VWHISRIHVCGNVVKPSCFDLSLLSDTIYEVLIYITNTVFSGNSICRTHGTVVLRVSL